MQISIDGSYVNWKFYRNLFQERKGEELPDLLNIGSCSLHVVHESLKKGAKESGWNLGNTLHSLWQIFHNILPEWKILFKLQAVICFPFSFVSIEDIKVAEQALKIWPHVNKYEGQSISNETFSIAFVFL